MCLSPCIRPGGHQGPWGSPHLTSGIVHRSSGCDIMRKEERGREERERRKGGGREGRREGVERRTAVTDSEFDSLRQKDWKEKHGNGKNEKEENPLLFKAQCFLLHIFMELTSWNTKTHTVEKEETFLRWNVFNPLYCFSFNSSLSNQRNGKCHDVFVS